MLPSLCYAAYMRVLSLFSGVGGFDMGLEAAGMKTVFQCEIDPHATSVLHYHWPDIPKWGDVTTLTGAYILEKTGGVDVVAWGSPCQDLSLAGKRKGLSGERSGLFHEGIRIIKELRELSNGKYPTWSIWENVYGALSSNRGADFGQVLYEMDEAGACFSEWAVLDAQYFGVPQRRRRVFITSCFDSATSERCPSPLLPVAESLRGDLAPRRAQRKGTSSKTAKSVGAGGSRAAGENDEGVLTTSVTSKWHKGTGGPAGAEHYNLVVEDGGAWWDGSQTAETLTVSSNEQRMPDKNRLQAVVTFSKSRRAQSVNDDETWVESEVTPTLNVFDVGDTRTTTAIVESAEQPVMLNFQGSKGNSITTEDGISFTLNAMHGHDVHVITDAIPIQDGREIEKQQNGIGVGIEGDPSYTIDQTGAQSVAYSIREDAKANNFSATEIETSVALQALQPSVQSHHAQTFVTQPLLVDGRRNDDVRVYQEPVQTLEARMGTGGNNVPVVAQDSTLSFDTQFGSNAAVFEGQSPTLKASQQSPSILQNTGDGYTLSGFGQYVDGVGTLKANGGDLGGGSETIVVSDGEQSNDPVVMRMREGKPGGGKGPLLSERSLTLAGANDQTVFQPDTQAVSYDGYNQQFEEEIHRPWRIGKDSSDFVGDLREETLVVRRLTPLECERLMGWPDGHTMYGTRDGKIVEISDTNRYKMCGNGVVSPVSRWIGSILLGVSNPD